MTYIKVYCVRIAGEGIIKTIEESIVKVFRDKDDAISFMEKKKSEGYACFQQTVVWG